ncbi:hypothetical protein [Methanomethylophilus alvi]|uniref:hypothetical protein n=1 Tax=Methanomethylophilus alvi TaxID=1291540 RepID=UPI0037DD2414
MSTDVLVIHLARRLRSPWEEDIAYIHIDEGGGIGRSERDIAECCPGTAVMPGLSVHGGSATSSDKCMEKWLRDGEVL